VTSHANVIQSSSLEVEKLPPGQFRLFSIDGGHTHETTLNDLRLVTKDLLPGGIVVVDDWLRHEWAGVTSAMIEFLVHEKKLMPFLDFGNKLWLTTPQHQHVYCDAVKASPYLKKSLRPGHKSFFLTDDETNCLLTMDQKLGTIPVHTDEMTQEWREIVRQQ